MMMMRCWKIASLPSSSAIDLLQRLELGNPKSLNSLPLPFFNCFYALNKESPLFYCQNSYFSTTPSKKSKYVFDKIDDALALFNHMLRTHPYHCIVEFGKLLSAIVRMRHYEIAISLWRQMELLEIHHNVYTLNILVNCFCRLHRMDFGFSVLGKMLKLGIEPDVITFSTYSTMIKGLCKERLLNEAYELFRKMQVDGCMRNSCSYNTMIQGCLHNNDISRAIQILHEMV